MIGTHLRQLRKAKGLTVREAAPHARCHFATLASIERGAPTSEDVLRRLARLYEVDPDELVLAGGIVPYRYLRLLMADPPRAVAWLRAFEEDHTP